MSQITVEQRLAVLAYGKTDRFPYVATVRSMVVSSSPCRVFLSEASPPEESATEG